MKDVYICYPQIDCGKGQVIFASFPEDVEKNYLEIKNRYSFYNISEPKKMEGKTYDGEETMILSDLGIKN